MEKINPETWSRREIYEFFSGVSDPFYMVTFRQDVTGIYRFAKANGLSFYHVMTWAVTKAVNEVDAFHYVCRGGEIFRLEERSPSFTSLRPGEELFRIITMPWQPDIRAFCEAAARRADTQNCFIQPELEGDSLLYISCLPWLDMSALTNERDRLAPDAAENSIPSIAWGKYEDWDGRKQLGISVEVNHRFIDGLHIGRFAEALSRINDSWMEQK